MLYFDAIGNTMFFKASSGTAGNAVSFSETMRIDSSGNVGIGCVPNSIQSGFDTLQIGGNLTLNVDSTGVGAGVYVGNNVYRDSGNSRWEYINTDEATQYIQANGEHIWRYAASGSANAAISWSEAMRIDSSGRVAIGGTTVTDANMLNIQGSGASSNIGVVFNNTNTSKIYGIQNGGSELRFHDYSASATRMRIDSSGNLLVGKTTIATGTAGIALRSNGEVRGTADGDYAARFSRLSSDGAIVGFEKDGSTVGSIGTQGGDLWVGTGNTGAYFWDGSNAIAPWNTSTNTARDAGIDLGTSSVRFKDAHFSGTANAANFNTTSDATLKTNVETLSGSLDAVKSLRGVSFDWLENGGSEIGVIAQEVEAVLPDVVSTNDEGIKSVKYGNMVAVLIEAIKEQQLRIEALEAQLNS
jgi:hypothetical protein